MTTDWHNIVFNVQTSNAHQSVRSKIHLAYIYYFLFICQIDYFFKFEKLFANI